MLDDHPGGRTSQKGQGEEKRNAGVVEKVFDRRAIFRAKRGNMRREFFLQCWKKKNGGFMKRKPHGYFFTDI